MAVRRRRSKRSKKKIREGHRSSGKKSLNIYTWVMEPRTAVHTMVKHAQEKSLENSGFKGM